MTVEQERDQLRERVRELEARWQDEIKIHLEAQHRIAKAKEILEKAYRYEEFHNDGEAIKLALEALEGK